MGFYRYTFAFFLSLLFIPVLSQAQLISYPVAAGQLTRGYSSSVLTVKLAFSGACAGDSVRIALPSSVTYIAGSVLKTAGSLSNAITESNISNLSSPTFNIGNVTAAGDITFTISRKADCGTAASGKDTVYLYSGCGNAVDSSGNSNSYNIFAPSLSISAPASVSNAVLGTTLNRSLTIKNGGNGCLDTLRYYAVYTGAGISLTSTGNTITANNISYTPTGSSGDTLFYKIAGNNVFVGKNTMCNGDTVLITEPIKINKCTPATAYGVSWGRYNTFICKIATNTGNVTMATGAASISSTFTRVQNLNWCQPGIYTLAIKNTGTTSGKESGAYNFLAKIGYNIAGTTTAPTGYGSSINVRVDSIKINGVIVSLTAATSTTPAATNFAALTSDPDGAGTGLEDLDGDGKYNDLPSGNTVTITVYEHWIGNSTCPLPTYNAFTSYTVGYTSMCGTSFTTNPLTVAGTASYRVLSNSVNITGPAEVTGNSPFTLQICENMSSLNEPAYKPKDSLYLDLILPTGMTLSPGPNILYNGAALTNGSYLVDTTAGVATLHIRHKSKSVTFCFSADLIFNCGIGTAGTQNLGVNIYYIGDSCSSSRENYQCTTKSIVARCPSPCTDGILNYQPVATRLSLGYTDATATAKVTPSAVTGTAKYSAVIYDTLQIIVPGKQAAALGAYANLYYNLQLGKTSSTTVFGFLSGTFNQVTGGSIYSSAIASPDSSFSTTSLETLRWNFSSQLHNALIITGDSVWLDLRFVVRNVGTLYGTTLQQVPGTSSTLYNINALNAHVGCDTAHLINLLVTGNSINDYTAPLSISGCNTSQISSSLYEGNSSGYDIFPVEFRPQILIDSVSVTLPAGYSLAPYNASGYSMTYNTWTSLLSRVTAGTIYATSSIQRTPTRWSVISPAGTGAWRSSDLNLVSSGSDVFSYSVVPTCAASVGTQASVISFYYRDFMYTNNAAVTANKTYSYTDSITYSSTTRPAVSVQNSTGIIAGVQATQYWDALINSTGTATASYIWMSLNNESRGIVVDSVKDIAGNALLPAINYGAGKNWYQVSTAGIAAGSSKQERIFFHYTSCNPDSLKMQAGWNCASYPSPNPDSSSCTAATQYLKIIPQQSEIQLSIARTPGNGGTVALCSQDSITVIVNSSQSANLVAPSITMYMPVGASVSTPLQVEYPLGSGTWANITPTAITGGYIIDLTKHPGISNNIPGTSVNSGASGRQAKLKVVFTTDCTFASGSQFDFLGFGNSPCGGTASGSGSDVRSGAVAITGVAVTAGMGLTLSVPVSSMTCGGTTTFTFSATPLITSTQNGDSILYNLPIGLAYNGNFVAVSNCGSCGVKSLPGSNGQNQVKIGLMPNIAANSTISFSFDVRVDGAGCGTTPVNAQAERIISGLSCGATTCAVSKAVIGTGNSTTIQIIKPNIVINDLEKSVNSNWYPGGTGIIAGSFTNNGTLATTANSMAVEFFCGNATTPFATALLKKAIAINATVPDTFTVNIPSTGCSKGNFITGKIRSTEANSQTQCICSDQSYTLAAIALPVDLLDFYAQLNGAESVNVGWQMANEQKISAYTVQRSTNGLDFIPVAHVAAKGNTGATTYAITDHDLPMASLLYYRLLLEATDGSASQSKTATVYLENNEDQVVILPNPATDNVLVSLPQTMQQRPVTVVFTNFLGQALLKQTFTSSDNIFQLSVAQLVPGLYYVNVVDGSGRTIATRKLSVVR